MKPTFNQTTLLAQISFHQAQSAYWNARVISGAYKEHLGVAWSYTDGYGEPIMLTDDELKQRELGYSTNHLEQLAKCVETLSCTEVRLHHFFQLRDEWIRHFLATSGTSILALSSAVTSAHIHMKAIYGPDYLEWADAVGVSTSLKFNP